MPTSSTTSTQRGLIHDTTDRAALAARLAEGPITLYYGCDPTAASLHHRQPDRPARAAPLPGRRPPPDRAGRRRHRDGRRPRRPLRGAQPARRGRRWPPTWPPSRSQIGRVLGPEGDVDAGRQPRLDRATSRLLDFLRDVGKHVTVNQMVARESVRARMASEHGISLHRVQLHAPPGQRLPLAARAPRAASSRSAAPTSGATSSRAST